MMQHQELLALAEQARANAYAPYSHYTVGAALLCASGKVYTGVNVENASYGATNCAERTALFSAVAAGERDFVAIAIAGGRQGEESGDCTPCGVCRQVLCELCSSDCPVILKRGSYRVGELVPLAFTENQL